MKNLYGKGRITVEGKVNVIDVDVAVIKRIQKTVQRTDFVGRFHTDDIAKAAGLSTGIVYHYFKDKKDILLIALDQRADALYEGFTEKFAATTEGNFEAFLNTLFDFLLEYHKQAWVIHEELEGLYHSDPEIAATTNKFWEKAYVSIAEIYAKKSGKPEHALEKTRMALDVIEDYCHACMNPIIESLDQDFMRQEAITIIKSLLT